MFSGNFLIPWCFIFLRSIRLKKILFYINRQCDSSSYTHLLDHYFCLQNMLPINTRLKKKSPRNTCLEHAYDIYIITCMTCISDFFILILFLIFITSTTFPGSWFLHVSPLAVILHVQLLRTLTWKLKRSYFSHSSL